MIDFFEITLRHGYFPVHLLRIFGTAFPKNTPGWELFQPSVRKFIKEKDSDIDVFM